MRRFAPAFLALFAACSQPKVVREGEGWRETESAVEITSDDPQVLAGIAKTHSDPRFRSAAIAKISDPAVLADVVRSEKDPALRKGAVERVDDETVLDQLAANDQDAGVKEAASSRRDVLRTVGSRHPEYKGWAGRAPGSWVRMKVEVKVQTWKSNVEIVRKLQACRPERAVLEQKDLATGKGVQGIFKEMLSGYDLSVGRSEENDGELEIGGQKVKCKWTRWSFSRGRDIVHIRRWHHEPIPGGVARIDLEVAPEGQPQRQMVAWVTGWGQ